MKRGKCPKCGRGNVRSGVGVWPKGGVLGGNAIPLGGMLGPPAPLDNYVCLDCGYVERYITNRSALDKIRAKWPKVPARNR